GGGIAAGVGGAAVHGHGVDRSGGTAAHEIAVVAGRFEDEAEVVTGRGGFDDGARSGGAGFFVGREQDGPAETVAVRRAFEGGKGGEHHDDAALHVGYAGTDEARAVGAELRRLKRVIGGEHRVVVTRAEHAPRRVGAKDGAQ